MEKPPLRSKGSRILKFLPKATSFSIPKQPYSPGRDKAHHRGFSGPMVSIVPAEARRTNSGGGGYQTPEPTSPKVSCIGQIKHKKKARRPPRGPSPAPSWRDEGKPRFALSRMFRGGGKKQQAMRGAGQKPPVAPASRASPALGQLRRFASGRDALANFDWRASRVADESAEEDYSGYYSMNGEDDSDDEVIFPFSAPILVGGGGGGGGVSLEPRKEVNLWKRRTMPSPSPLHVE